MRRLTVVAASTVLVLAGCSDSAETEYDLPVGPISEQVGDQFHQDVGEAANALLELKVAECMRAQGFDYQIPAPRDDVPAWGTLEFAQTYGYGITTWADLPQAEASQPPSDEAYQAALWGEADPDETATTPWVPGGCRGQALTQTGLLDSTIVQDLDDLARQAVDDERVVTAQASWATCMADAGYDYTTGEQAQASIVDRASADGQPLTGAALTALRTEEIATAVADYGCSTDLRRAKATVVAELETYYYTDNASKVDALLTLLGELK